VIDITGVAAMDSHVANHLVQTVEGVPAAGRDRDRDGGCRREIAQTPGEDRRGPGQDEHGGVTCRAASRKPSACSATRWVPSEAPALISGIRDET